MGERVDSVKSTHQELMKLTGEPQKEKAVGLRPAFFYTIVLMIFASDQLSKAWITHSMAWSESRSIIGANVMLTLTRNTGGAWGVMPSGNHIFTVFAAIAIVALLYAYHKIARNDLLVASAFSLALGGAVGNLLDRLRFGYVVDFFDVRIIRWPIFNVADSAITVAVVLLLLHYAFSVREEVTARSAAWKDPAAASVQPLAAEDLSNSTHD